jgi:hypothetical protein
MINLTIKYALPADDDWREVNFSMESIDKQVDVTDEDGNLIMRLEPSELIAIADAIDGYIKRNQSFKTKKIKRV